MGKNYLLDTNAILDFMGDKLPTKSKLILSQIIDEQINISVINKIELLGFDSVEQEIVDFVSFSNVFPFDESIVDLTIEIRRLYKPKLPDAIIAATSMYNDLILLTTDKDFRKIIGLKVESPYELNETTINEELDDENHFSDLVG